MSIDRYKKQSKSERNRQLYLFLQLHQELSLEDIGKFYIPPISKQRVSFIIAREAEIIENENTNNKVAA